MPQRRGHGLVVFTVSSYRRELLFVTTFQALPVNREAFAGHGDRNASHPGLSGTGPGG